jgi:N-acetylmuramoyl-L-alanine amidase
MPAVVGRWRRAAALALGSALSGLAAPGRALELRSVRTAGTPEGAAVTLSFSGPVRPTVATVHGPGGELARLYIDAPAGTRLPSLQGGDAAAGPVGRVRVGIGDRGVVRVVIDLTSSARYRLRQSGRQLTVAVIADGRGTPGSQVATSSSPPRQPGMRPKIVLDPGHGGHDPGAQGYAVEKDVTLAIARKLRRLLRERLGAEVVLTRDDDATLALADRTARANAEGADLFVSIHANASSTGRLHGIETYYLDNTQDRATIRLAALENGLDLLHPARGQTDLRYILSDLVQVGKMDESIALASTLQRHLVRHLRGRYPGVADLGVKRGPFYVLVGAYMPCVLVETSFLTHPIEGPRLTGPAYQATVAEGLADGIARFVADSARSRTL